MFTSLEVEESQPGVLGSQQSFGQHLHLKGGATGQIQLMQDAQRVFSRSMTHNFGGRERHTWQDWEWPYMFALADSGFQIASQNGSKALRVLEIGWGQVGGAETCMKRACRASAVEG